MPLSEKLLAIAIRAQNFTGASGVAVAIKEGDEVVCRASWGTSAPDVGVRLRDQSSFTYQCLRAGIPMRCDDAASDPRVDPEACANLGISSIAAAPVGQGEDVLGVIAAFSEDANAFTETHMVVLTTLGEVVAKFLKDELPAVHGIAADEPLSLEADSVPTSDVDPLQEIAAEIPAVAEPALTEAGKVEAPQPEAPPVVPAVSLVSSILKAARSKLPVGAVEHDPEVKAEEMRPSAEVPAAPGLVSSAEPINSSKREKPSASVKPLVISRSEQEKPAAPALRFEVPSGFDWHTVLQRKFLIPVGAAAVLVFALVTWTFHSFRSRHVAPPVAVEQPAESAPAQEPEPAELTSAVPTTSTVMDVSVKTTTEKPAHNQKPEKAPDKADKATEPPPVLETTAEVRHPSAIPLTRAQSQPVAAPPPSLSLVEVPTQLPALKAALPTSNVVGPSVSHLVPSKLLHSQAPMFPETARRFHLSGTVVLSAKVGTDGKVKSVTVVSGPAVFQANAISAVKSWRYRPATLDGEAVESTADITLNFAVPR